MFSQPGLWVGFPVLICYFVPAFFTDWQVLTVDLDVQFDVFGAAVFFQWVLAVFGHDTVASSIR
jgi:hypothetical protein